MRDGTREHRLAPPVEESVPIHVGELDLAEPGPGEVLVRIEAAGQCHSDFSVVDGNRIRPIPILLGHEAAGIVEQLGAGVDDIAVGQRIIMTFLPRCGHCEACATNGLTPCINGSASNAAGTLLSGGLRLTRDGETIKHHQGVSGFATHSVVDRRSIVPVDSDVPPDIAAVLGCAILTGGGAVINAGKPVAGQRVVVVGMGGVGMAALLTALAINDVEVIAVDPLESKRTAASEAGAHAVYSPDEATELGIKAPIVIECAGNIRAFETGIALTGMGGQTITVGLPSPDARAAVSPMGLVAEGRSIVGSYLGSAVPSRDIPVFVDLWRAGKLPAERLITSTIALTDINAGMDALADGRAIRQIIRFEDGQ